MDIKKGQIIALTTGEYSDYCLRDHVRALGNFDTADKVQEFQETDECRGTGSYNRHEKFMAWLVRTGAVEPIGDEVQEWHIGSYGDLTA